MNNPDRAIGLLKDEFFISVVEKQRQMYIENILTSREDDIETRERSIVKFRALEEFIASIQSIADSREIEKKRKGFIF
jgi:hypothetical protein